MRLIELNPEIKEGRLNFDNPVLKLMNDTKDRISLPIHNPFSGERIKAKRYWKISSEDFNTMSVTPSIEGIFNIVNGEVRIVKVSPPPVIESF